MRATLFSLSFRECYAQIPKGRGALRSSRSSSRSLSFRGEGLLRTKVKLLSIWIPKSLILLLLGKQLNKALILVLFILIILLLLLLGTDLILFFF